MTLVTKNMHVMGDFCCRCAQIAMVTEDELESFESKIGHNYARSTMDADECPKCKSLIIKEKKKHSRCQVFVAFFFF